MGGQHAPMGLGDLFFDPGDPLHPDADEDEDEDDDEPFRLSDAMILIAALGVGFGLLADPRVGS